MQIKLCDVTKKYKNEIDNTIENINLTFSSGEFVSIVGESGSGKSTLMNIIGGLDMNYDGKLLVDGKVINNKNVDLYRKNNIGFIFQSFNLLPHLTAYENVLLALRLNNNIDKIKIDKIFKDLNIENIKSKKPNELSGGQKQRVAIARALVNNPDIILADEPTGALDSKNSDNIVELLQKIASMGKIVIVVTHSKKVSEKCSREILISNKTIINDKINYDSYTVENKKIKKNTKKIKLLNLIKLSMQNIRKNIKRNLLIILASSIGIFGISFMFFLGSGVKKYVNNEINMSVNPNVIEVNKTDSMLDTVKFTEKDINTIKNISHVDKINKNISISNLSSVVLDNKKYDLVSLSTFSNIKESELKIGKKCSDNEIIISEYLARKMNKNINQLLNKKLDLYIIDNDKPTILKKEVSISGILMGDDNDFTNNMYFSYISFNTLKDLYNVNDVELNISDLSVHVDEIKNVNFVKKKIVEAGFKHSNMSKMVDDILNYLDIITFILVGISSISLLVSSIMIFIVMHINVIERTKEIGIFRALGSRVSEIKNIFLFESSLIGLFSGLYGCIMSSIISKLINIYTKNKFDEVFINIDIKYILICIMISILISTISGLKPSIKASKLDPVESLRYE